MSKKPHEITILVVDDDEFLREMISLELQHFDFQVVNAASGDEAFEIIRKQNIDLVFSDVRMPKGDGITLLERTREIHPTIPVVLMTGYSDFSVDKCIAKGANKVLSKPFKKNEIVDTVLEFISSDIDP